MCVEDKSYWCFRKKMWVQCHVNCFTRKTLRSSIALWLQDRSVFTIKLTMLRSSFRSDCVRKISGSTWKFLGSFYWSSGFMPNMFLISGGERTIWGLFCITLGSILFFISPEISNIERRAVGLHLMTFPVVQQTFGEGSVLHRSRRESHGCSTDSLENKRLERQREGELRSISK